MSLSAEEQSLYDDLYSHHPDAREFVEIESKRDFISQWRAIKAFTGNDVDNYPIEFAAIFNEKEAPKPTDNFNQSFSKFAKREAQQIIEMALVCYPLASDLEKGQLRSIIITAKQYAAREVWDKKSANDSLTGTRGIVKTVGSLLHKLHNHEPEMDNRGSGYDNGINVALSYKYLGELKISGDQQKQLDEIAKKELGSDIYEKLMFLKKSIYKDIKKAPKTQVNRMKEDLISSRLENILEAYGNTLDRQRGDAAAIANYFELATKYPIIVNMQTPPPSEPSRIAAVLTAFQFNPRYVVGGLLIAIVVVLVIVALYYFIKSVLKKERMNIIPRSTLRKLNPYNQTFFI